MNRYNVLTLRMKKEDVINYSYVIIDKTSKEAAIIDPAYELEKVEAVLHEYDAKLSKILITHSHSDHVDLVDRLVRMYNTQVYMSAREIEYYDYTCENLHSLEDKQTIDIGNTQISSLLTPGHTVGSMCFLLPDTMFTGDTIFTEGCGICNIPGGCPSSLFETVQHIKHAVRKDTVVFPGHSFGNGIGHTLGYLCTHNAYFDLDRETFIYFRMREIDENAIKFY